MLNGVLHALSPLASGERSGLPFRGTGRRRVAAWAHEWMEGPRLLGRHGMEARDPVPQRTAELVLLTGLNISPSTGCLFP